MLHCNKASPDLGQVQGRWQHLPIKVRTWFLYEHVSRETHRTVLSKYQKEKEKRKAKRKI